MKQENLTSAAACDAAATNSIDDAKISIEVRDVVKQYGDGPNAVTSLSDLNLEIRDGEFLVIVGPSGCGKSTLLKLIAGFTEVTSGEIKYHSQGKHIDPKEDIGYVFQSPMLVPWRNVRRNILLQIEMRGRSVSEANALCDELLKVAGLTEFGNKFPWQLSGGMQQRVAICRALIHDPSLILMDEPFGALDAMTREKMNLALQAVWMKSHKTVLLVTHSIAEAVFLADRIVVMSERPGKVEKIYEVSAPRPRTLSSMSQPAFTETMKDVRSHFFHDDAQI